MERRGGCCIARYGSEADVASKVGRIMLRFRPIAPKPIAATANPDVADSVTAVISKRGGRRWSSSGSGSGSRRGRRKRCPTAVVEEEEEEVRSKKREKDPTLNPRSDPILTLPLMPETPERGEAGPVAEMQSPPSDSIMPCASPPWYGRRERQHTLLAPTPLRLSLSLVTVECCLTDTNDVARWMPLCSEAEAKVKLKEENLPAFISDADGELRFRNAAFLKMVGEEKEEGGARVVLTKKGRLSEEVMAFACCVRVCYASSKERGSRTVPCDTCRLGGGGFAWRLDIDTALSL